MDWHTSVACFRATFNSLNLSTHVEFVLVAIFHWKCRCQRLSARCFSSMLRSWVWVRITGWQFLGSDYDRFLSRHILYTTHICQILGQSSKESERVGKHMFSHFGRDRVAVLVADCLWLRWSSNSFTTLSPMSRTPTGCCLFGIFGCWVSSWFRLNYVSNLSTSPYRIFKSTAPGDCTRQCMFKGIQNGDWQLPVICESFLSCPEARRMWRADFGSWQATGANPTVRIQGSYRGFVELLSCMSLLSTRNGVDFLSCSFNE